MIEIRSTPSVSFFSVCSICWNLGQITSSSFDFLLREFNWIRVRSFQFV